MRLLEGKIVFLTGGGVSGRASAELFAQEGAKVAVIDALKDKAEETSPIDTSGATKFPILYETVRTLP